MFLALLLAVTGNVEKDVIQNVFGRDSIMVEVARCESGLRHWDNKGLPLKGRAVPADTGVFQVNKTYHKEEAEKMGYDLDSLAGNVMYAKYLYDKNGLRDWEASKNCWQKSPAIAKL